MNHKDERYEIIRVHLLDHYKKERGELARKREKLEGEYKSAKSGPSKNRLRSEIRSVQVQERHAESRISDLSNRNVRTSSLFEGGSYTELQKRYKGLGQKGVEIEVHHLVPTSVSNVPEKHGGAIAMLKEDHRPLDSTGRSEDKDFFRGDMEDCVHRRDSKGAYALAVSDVQMAAKGNGRSREMYDPAMRQAMLHNHKAKLTYIGRKREGTEKQVTSAPRRTRKGISR